MKHKKTVIIETGQIYRMNRMDEKFEHAYTA